MFPGRSDKRAHFGVERGRQSPRVDQRPHVDWVHEHQLHRLVDQDDRQLARELGITGPERPRRGSVEDSAAPRRLTECPMCSTTPT